MNAPRGGGGRRIFVSRRGARWRRLTNEDAIAKVLASRGFEEVDAGRLTLAEQIALGAETEVMVGCFGAGMNMQLFLGEGVPIVQLQIEQRVRMNIHVPIAGELGQPFHPVIGEVTNRHPDPLKSDFAVKPARVLEALDRAGIR